MSREDILTVGLRLFALWLALFAVQQLVQAVGITAGNEEWADQRAWMVSVALLPLAFAVFLWFFPLTVVTRLLPRLKSDHTPLSVEADVMLDTGIILIGLWWLLSSLAWTLSAATWWVLTPTDAAQAHVSDLVSSLLMVVASLLVLLRGPGIVGAIRRFRAAGYTPSTSRMTERPSEPDA